MFLQLTNLLQMVLGFYIILPGFIESLQEEEEICVNSERETESCGHLSELEFLSHVLQVVPDDLHTILVLLELQLKFIYLLSAFGHPILKSLVGFVGDG